MSCPFCENKEIQERMIVKNDVVMVFPTNIPIVPGHVLVCPVRHVGNVSDLTREEVLAVFSAIEELRKVLQKVFGAEGFNYAWNEGKLAGQSVPHVHFHVLPRKEGDTGITQYEPRQFLYRPGSREETPQGELKVITESIKKYF